MVLQSPVTGALGLTKAFRVSGAASLHPRGSGARHLVQASCPGFVARPSLPKSSSNRNEDQGKDNNSNRE